MSGPLENQYFKWLCAKVIQVVHPTPSLTYKKLFHILHTTEFVWLVLGDDNRCEDGKELRDQFILETNAPENPEWMSIGCSVLEMLIAFSRRAEFQTGDSAKQWFWEFLKNLGLDECNDADIEPVNVEEILERFIWRTYWPNGVGGLFPLENPKEDQRQVEIWYQYCAYLVDQDR
jgi:hypothetical protein